MDRKKIKRLKGFFKKKQIKGDTVVDYKLDMEIYISEINQDNYIELTKIANKQYSFLAKHTELSGFLIVNWRVIFSNLFTYQEAIPHPVKANKHLMKFYNYYEEESADELYKRLDIP